MDTVSHGEVRMAPGPFHLPEQTVTHDFIYEWNLIKHMDHGMSTVGLEMASPDLKSRREKVYNHQAGAISRFP